MRVSTLGTSSMSSRETIYNGGISFSRLTIGANEQMRTASEVIASLDLASINSGSRDTSPFEIQEQHDRAFDVEPVTKHFFAAYRRVFEDVETRITGLADSNRKRLFTQRLFNRLMFIAFIQKKGWLRLGIPEARTI